MSSEKQKKYGKYLQTKEWKEKRDAFKSAYQNKCCMCGKTEDLHIHHLTYDNLENETINDVVCLCKGCHLDVHKKRLTIWTFTEEERRHFDKIRHIICSDRNMSYLFLKSKWARW